MLLPARGSGGLLVVSNDSGHDKQNFTGGVKVFTVGQKSAFTVGKIWCSRLAKFGVHSWQKYANAMNALEIYDAHSPMGSAMSSSDFKLTDMLDGKTTLYVILPEAKIETHGSALGLIATLLLEEIARASKPSPIMMLLEEMGNIGKLPNLSKALSLLPFKGVRLWMVFQSRRQPIDIYGQQMAGLIEEQSSLVQAWSIRGELDRKAWSARIGNLTKKARSYSRDQSNPHSPWRLSINERAAPVITPDEIGRLSLDQQLIAIDGQMVIKADRLAYFQIEPWRSLAKKSPYHGNKYPKDKPVHHKLGGRS